MKRRRLTSKHIWTSKIFDRFRIPCTYKQSIEIITRLHGEFIDFVRTKRRPVCINKTIGSIEFIKLKPKNKVYMKTEGSSIKLLVNHETQGYLYRYIMRPAGREKMLPYKLFPARKINRSLKEKIINRELR